MISSHHKGLSVQDAKIKKLTADAKYGAFPLRLTSGPLLHSHHDADSLDDVKACIAVLTFAITSAAKFGVDGDTLSAELQQLGLPKGELSPLRSTRPLATDSVCRACHKLE